MNHRAALALLRGYWFYHKAQTSWSTQCLELYWQKNESNILSGLTSSRKEQVYNSTVRSIHKCGSIIVQDQESNQWLLGASGFSMWLISVPATGDNKQPNCSQKGSVDSSQPQAVASLNQTFAFTYTLPARRSAHPMLACRVFLHLIHLTSFLTISEKAGFKKCLINWSSAVQARCVLKKI